MLTLWLLELQDVSFDLMCKSSPQSMMKRGLMQNIYRVYQKTTKYSLVYFNFIKSKHINILKFSNIPHKNASNREQFTF